MKSIKNVITALTFILLLAGVNNLSAHNSSKDWKSEIVKHLNDFDKLDKRDVPDKVYIDFILNPKGEIMILTTSNPTIDKWLKSKLNYKRINSHDLELMQKYTLPIVFDKK